MDDVTSKSKYPYYNQQLNSKVTKIGNLYCVSKLHDIISTQIYNNFCYVTKLTLLAKNVSVYLINTTFINNIIIKMSIVKFVSNIPSPEIMLQF